MTTSQTHFRLNINGQIKEKLADLGIPATFAYVPEQGGRMMWIIGAEKLTPGEAADKYLPGGWAGSFSLLGR